MINNRQGGRRRGRGGGGGSGRVSSGSPGPGNRQDNRQRGNAAQLLEKFKSMARDAQMQGDRVQTEYYLQFAEHYYRVLNENRARFEEQRPRSRDDFYEEDEEQDEGVTADSSDGDDSGERDARDERPAREERPMREDRGARDDRGDRESPRGRPDHRNGEPRHHDRQRRDRYEAQAEEGEERISLDVLPPAIAAPVAPIVQDQGAEEPKAPRRRLRRPRDEGDTDIAPAA